MNPETKNNQSPQPPLDMTPADRGYFAALGAVAEKTELRDNVGDRVMEVRRNDGSPDQKAQANLDYEAADMARQSAERAARRQGRPGAARAISSLFSRHR